MRAEPRPVTIGSLGLAKEEERCRWLCFYRKTLQNAERSTADLISRRCCWFFAERGRHCLSDRRTPPQVPRGRRAGCPCPHRSDAGASECSFPTRVSDALPRRNPLPRTQRSLSPAACHKQETETNKAPPTRGPGCPQHRPGTPWPQAGQWPPSSNVGPRREGDAGRWGMRTTGPPRVKTPNTRSA